MLPPAHILIDPSQFPDQVRLDLIESLRAREVNHKFHYDSVKQTHKWLTLHEKYSPARTDPECLQIYQAAFEAAGREMQPGAVRVMGLGAGGGQKDAELLKRLRKSGRDVTYTPCDVSTAMVLVARESALSEISAAHCSPVVCDLAKVEDLRSLLAGATEPANGRRSGGLFTFFGMMPNFEPEAVLPKLADALDSGDVLLLSANLAPGADYAMGVQRVLPLYDNEPTRDWLLTFLLDLGVEKTDGQLRFAVEQTSNPIPLQRIVARFEFIRERTLPVGAERFEFRPGETIRLFFSYRHTRELMRALLARYGLELMHEWITSSGEEGVFLARKNERA